MFSLCDFLPQNSVLICLNSVGKHWFLSEDCHLAHANFTKWLKDYQLKILSIKHRSVAMTKFGKLFSYTREGLEVSSSLFVPRENDGPHIFSSTFRAPVGANETGPKNGFEFLGESQCVGKYYMPEFVMGMCNEV